MSDTKPNREQALFEAASEIPDAAERRAFLDQACRDDPALRARLELLLEGHFQAEGFLTKPPQHAALPSQPPSVEAPSTMISRYKLLEKIGEGGFGDVWMAEQQEPVKRRVAVKILKLGMDTKQVVGRFEAERQALALMDHPNIARVLDAGATETGRPYFVMDLVRGIRITDYCDQHQLSTRERLDLFIQVCHAIQHAHQKGIIHRDIKPSNILVTLHDGEPVPKIIDFGIAKATQQALTDKTLFTQFQQFIGTPTYVSPEQAGMSGLDIDTRTDIYSLGVLLYELLVGRTPFDTQELLQGGLDALRQIIREREPQRPSTKLNMLSAEEQTTTAQRRQTDAPKLMHLLRGDLDWIVMKCLEKDRRRRYETANALAADLQRHLAHEPVEARPPGKLYRAGRFVRRHCMGVAFSVGAVVILVAGLVLTLLGFAEARRERDAKTAALAQAELEAARAKAVSELLLSMLDSANPDAAKGTDYTVRELLDTFSASLGDRLKDQPEVELSIRSSIGKAYVRLRDTKKATLHLDAALQLAKQCFGAENPHYAEILLDRAHASLPSAEEFARQAVSICRKHLEKPEHTIHALRALQECLLKERPEESEKLALEALACAAQFPNREFAEICPVLHLLAQAQMARSDLAQAETTARQALAIARRLLDPNHPEIAWSLRILGVILGWQKKFPEAEAALREADAIFQRNYGPNHSAVLLCMDSLTSVLAWQGKLDEVEALRRENLSRQRKVLGVEHPAVAVAREELCLVLADQGKFNEAERVMRESAGLSQSLPAEALEPAGFTNYPLVLEIVSRAVARSAPAGIRVRHCYTHGTLLYRVGRYPEALQQFAEAYELGGRRELETARITPAYGAYFLAMTHGQLGHTNEAADWFRRAFTLDPTVREPSADTLSEFPWNRGVNFGLLRQEAETVLRSKLGTVPGLADLQSSQTAWAAVSELLRKGRDACINGRWAKAADAFEAALKDPAFDWQLAGPDLPTPEQWMAIAFARVRAHDLHLRLFLELHRTEGKPIEALRGYLWVMLMLLPANPAPELLTLSSNLLPASEVVFSKPSESVWFHLVRSLLEYRSGHYAEALSNARKAMEGNGPVGKTHVLSIQSMASYRLGQTNEARILWQQANALMPEVDRLPKSLTNIRKSLLVDYLLDEAAALLGLENELPAKPATEAQPTNAVAPR